MNNTLYLMNGTLYFTNDTLYLMKSTLYFTNKTLYFMNDTLYFTNDTLYLINNTLLLSNDTICFPSDTLHYALALTGRYPGLRVLNPVISTNQKMPSPPLCRQNGVLSLLLFDNLHALFRQSTTHRLFVQTCKRR